MNKRIVITKETLNNEEFIVTSQFEDDRLAEINCSKMDERRLLERICIAKVKKMQESIQAAFVELEPGVMGYLPYNQMIDPIPIKRQREAKWCEEDELLVQVIKEPSGNKAAVVSSKLTLSGNFVVLTTGNTTFGMSKKITAEKRQSIKEFFADQENDRFGIIMRSSCESAALSEINDELARYQELMIQILEKSKYRTCFSILYESMPAYIRPLLGLIVDEMSDKLFTDSLDIFQEITRHQSLGQVANIANLYLDTSITLSSLYGIKYKIKDAVNKKVWLKSGAYLILELTEALFVIDVNSGKNQSRKKDFFYDINREAAKEIAFQLRLRNISGICIIDFINMEDPELEKKLLQDLRDFLKQDSVPSRVIDITKLGLVEVTRKKIKTSLYEQLRSEQKQTNILEFY
ncbi:MAG: ribonuclease E/G [Lachnospiraceae bacterium]